MGNSIIKQEAVTTLATKLEVDNVSLLNMLAKTACKDIKSDDELLAFVIICANYQLNPLVKEIYAFKNSFGAIVPVVGVDGWLAIANRNPQFDGIQCEPIFEDGKVTAIKCTIWRKDRNHPAIHIEYMKACKLPTKPWQSHPERMLEWKAIIQTVRIAFSISGIYDPDEAELIEPDKPVQQIELKFDDEDIPDADFSEKPSDVMRKKIADDAIDPITPKKLHGNGDTLKATTGKNALKRKDLLAPPGDNAEEFDKTHGKAKLDANVEAEILLFAKEANITIEAASIITTAQKKNPDLFKEAKNIVSRKLLQKFTSDELEKLAKLLDMEAK